MCGPHYSNETNSNAKQHVNTGDKDLDKEIIKYIKNDFKTMKFIPYKEQIQP